MFRDENKNLILTDAINGNHKITPMLVFQKYRNEIRLDLGLYTKTVSKWFIEQIKFSQTPENWIQFLFDMTFYLNTERVRSEEELQKNENNQQNHFITGNNQKNYVIVPKNLYNASITRNAMLHLIKEIIKEILKSNHELDHKVANVFAHNLVYVRSNKNKSEIIERFYDHINECIIFNLSRSNILINVLYNLKCINEEENSLTYYIKQSVKNYNPILIKIFGDMNCQDQLQQFINYYNKKNRKNISIYENLKKLDDENAINFYNEYLSFSSGLHSSFDGSHSSHDGAALYLSQLALSKKYDINSTIIQDEFLEDYLKLLRKLIDTNNLTEEIEERIVVVNGHWICVEFKIDSRKNVNILILDSTANVETFSYSHNIITKINKILPQATIYFPAEKNQNDLKSCYIYNLRYSKLLSNIKNYLPLKYAQSGIFGYLKDHVLETKLVEVDVEQVSPKDFINVHHCSLPLKLCLEMQSTELELSIKDKVLEQFKMKKNGQTAIEISERNFKYDESKKKKTNRGIKRKLNKMKCNVALFLTKNDKNIELIKSQSTLDEYENKINRLLKKSKK